MTLKPSKTQISLLLLVCGVLVTSPYISVAQTKLVLPQGDRQIRAVRLVNIPRSRSGGAEAAILTNKSLYIAGKSWNEEDDESLWLWRLDVDGKRLWEKQLVRQEKNEELKIVRLLPGAKIFSQGPAAQGVRVVYRQGLETRLAFIKADGEVVLEESIGILENTEGLVVDQADHMILFGNSMTVQDQPGHAWAARVTRLGAVLWKHTFDAADGQSDPQNAAGESAVPKGHYRGTYLFDGTLLQDGSVAMVGQTGVYNKFGQGPSKLWLLRIDVDGKELAEHFIDDGRILPVGQEMIVACEDGLIVPYSTEQLPPIASAPGGFPPGFGLQLARYDATLGKVWDKTAAVTAMPGAATITGPAPFILLFTLPEQLNIRAINEQGEEVGNAKVDAPGGFLTPLATLRTEDELIAICNYRASGSTDAELQVLLVYATLPQQRRDR